MMKSIALVSSMAGDVIMLMYSSVPLRRPYHVVRAINHYITYIAKSKALQILKQSVGHIAPERLQRFVQEAVALDSFICSNEFVRDFQDCPYCALAKLTHSSFASPIPIPDQISFLFFADAQGPFAVAALQVGVYKIGIIESTTKYLLMYMLGKVWISGSVLLFRLCVLCIGW